MSVLNRGHLNAARLAADPKVFTNSDGSKSVHVTVYVDRAYKNADGSRPSDRIQLETWLRPETAFDKTPFGYMHQGDKVAFEYELRSSTYADKTTGEMRYEQVAHITDVALLDSLATTNARLAQRIAGQQKAAATATATTEVPQPATADEADPRPFEAQHGPVPF